jgi:hypothetical protein
MPRGGRRTGSGRKKGLPNGFKSIVPAAFKRSVELQADAEGVSPLRILLRFANDEDLPVSLRLAAASAAAPFVHRKLAPLPTPMGAQFDADGVLIEGVSSPVAPCVTTITILPMERGHFIDDPAPVRDAEPVE